MKPSGPGIGSEFGLSRAAGYQYSSPDCVSSSLSGEVSYVANGRAALGLAIRYLRLTAKGDSDCVLLPSYLCHSMIQPFQEQGLQIEFYPVTDELSIDPRAVSERVSGATLAVLLMHYFGFGQPVDLVTRLLEDHPQVTIVDDRTHMLGTDLCAGELGTTAAISVYSPRKWGPFPDIGLVVWPRSPALSEPLPQLLDGGYDLGFAFWRLVGVMLRALYSAFPVETVRRISLRPFRRADDLLNRRVRVCRASPFSRFLWYHWEWSRACRVRRANYQYLLDHWTATEIVPLYRQLPVHVCPLGFPVRTHEREELRRRLIAEEIYPPIHWVRPVDVSAQVFPRAAMLAEEELTLPIDQRYTLQQMDRILNTVSEA